MSKYLPWKNFEGDIVRLFKGLGFSDAKRNIEQSRTPSGRDVLNVQPYCVQCKYGKPHIKKAWQEANTEAKSGEIPVAFTRFRKEQLTLVTMSVKDFKWLISK